MSTYRIPGRGVLIQIDKVNCYAALRETAEALGFYTSYFSEEIEDPKTHISTTRITGYDVWNNDVRYIVHICEHSRFTTPVSATKALIRAMYKETSSDRTEQGVYFETTDSSKKAARRQGLEIVQHADPPQNPRMQEISKSEDSKEKKKAEVKSAEQPHHEQNLLELTRFHVLKTGKVCPFCRGELNSKRCNVPVYTVDNHFLSFYVSSVFHCSQCGENIMPLDEWNALLCRLQKDKHDVRIKPVNMRYKSGTRSTRYLYEPIYEPPKTIHAANVSKYQGKNNSVQDDRFLSMNETSILSEAGYTTSLPVKPRQAILREVAQRYGKRKVADLLRMFIRLHIHRSNYENALSIWQMDLDYIARQ